jgi:hypothetical protein
MALRITIIQLRLGLADTVLYLALSIAHPHWSTRSVVTFKMLIESIKADLDDH